MKTLRKGDKGDEVKKLQELLNKRGYNLVADSDFGNKTYNAVVAFQKSKGLDPDGVVGKKTWEALGVTEETKIDPRCVDASVVYYPLKYCITKKASRAIKYLIIHYTAGASSVPGKAAGMKAGWEKKREASADFGVDDHYLIQFNPDLKNYYCWQTGGGNGIVNANSISIEICSNLKSGYTASKPNHEGWYFTEAALSNAVKLAKILMRKYNIPIERVVRHYDSSGKVCPGVIGWTPTRIYDAKGNKTSRYGNENAWKAFKERLT